MNKSKRTRLIRGLGWAIASLASLAAVVVLALAAYLMFFDYPEMLRENLERELTNVSGRPAKVGSISLNIPRYGIELRDIEVGSGGEDGATLAVERVEGRLSLIAMLRQELHWNELVIHGLSVRLVETEDGELAVRVGEQAQPLGSSAISVVADSVSFTDASFVLDNERVPWHLEARDLSLAVERAGFSRYNGKLLYEDGSLVIKDHPPLDAAVSADFELTGGELYLKESVARTTFGELHVTGKVGFTGATRGRFDVEADGEIGPAAETILGIRAAREVASGSAEFHGTLTLEPDNKIVEGTLLLPRGELGGLPVSDWRGEVFWDRTLLQLSYAAGAVGGGAARVQLHQALPVRENEASVEIDLERGSLQQLLKGLADVDFPLESSVALRASLRFDALSRDTRGVHGELDVRGSNPSPEPGSGLAFAARARLSDGDLEIESGSFSTRSLVATFSGLYPSEGDAQLLVEASCPELRDLDDLQGELRATLDSEASPLPSLAGIQAGRGRTRGYVSGRWPSLVFDGELTAEALRVRGLELDEVRTRSTISAEAVTLEDAVLTRGDGTMAGSGRLSLEGSEPDFRVALSISRWPADELLRGLGVEAVADIEGELSGDVSVRRDGTVFSGEASVSLGESTLGGIPFDGGEGRVTLDGATLHAESLKLRRRGAELAAKLDIDLSSRAVTGEAGTTALPLAGLTLFGLPLEGEVETRADVGGSLSAPVVTVAGRGRSLSLGGVVIGEGFLTGSLREGMASVQVTMERVASNVALDADVVMTGSYPATGTLTWRDLDLAPWLIEDAASLRLSSTGQASFRSEQGISEPLASAEVEATLQEVNVEGDSFRFASVEPVSIRLRDRKLVIAPVELLQGESRVSVGGLVDFADQSVDLNADGVVSLGVLGSLNRDIRGSGDVDLEARLEGEWRRPSLTGYADFDGGSVRLADFPQALGGLHGRVVFDNQTMRVEELRGVFGSGPVSIKGAVVLDGRRLGSVDLATEATGVRIRYPEGLVATADAELSLVGGTDGRILAGTVRLRDAVWSREYELVAGILSDREDSILFEEFEDEELLEGLQFDIEVSADESLKLRNSVADIDASARLSLRGTVREPVILGSSEAVRGELYFLGQRYDIMTGRVDFVDPERVEPFIDLAAEARVRSYRVELRLIGTPDRFQPELSSDPPLRTVEILRLLAGASDRQLDIRGNEEEELAGVGVASLLTERLTQEVGRRAERLFGLDRFSIDPFLVGQFANPTARMSLGKRITPELFINYSTNLNATAEAIILIEYTPEGPMTWVLSRDEEGDVGIDVKFRKSF